MVHPKPFVPSTGEIVFTVAVVVLLCFLVFASNKAKGDTSTATLGGKLFFFFMAAVAMLIGTVLAILLPRHRSYAIHYSPQEIARIEAEGAAPTAKPGPRVRPDSTVRFGDTVKIVCGSASCTAALTRQEAEPSSAAAQGDRCQIKSGTEAVVSLYNPAIEGTNIAEVYLTDGSQANKVVWVPGRWLHKIKE